MIAAVALAGVAALPVAIAITQFNERGTPYTGHSRGAVSSGDLRGLDAATGGSARPAAGVADVSAAAAAGPVPANLAAASSTPAPRAVAAAAVTSSAQTLADALQVQSQLWAGTSEGDALGDMSASAAAAAAASASAAAASASSAPATLFRNSEPLNNFVYVPKYRTAPDIPLSDANAPLEPMDRVQDRLVRPPPRDAFDPKSAMSVVERSQYEDNVALVQRAVGASYQHPQQRDDTAQLNKTAMKLFDLNKPPPNYTVSSAVFGIPNVIPTRGNLSLVPAAPMQTALWTPEPFHSDLTQVRTLRETAGDTTGASKQPEMPPEDAANVPVPTRTDHIENTNKLVAFLPWHDAQRTDEYFNDESKTLRTADSTVVPKEATAFSDSDIDTAMKKLRDAAAWADQPVSLTTDWLAPTRAANLAVQVMPSTTAAVVDKAKAEADIQFNTQTQTMRAVGDLNLNRPAARVVDVSNPSTAAQPTNGAPIGPTFGNISFRTLEMAPNRNGWIPSGDTALTNTAAAVANGNGFQTVPASTVVPVVDVAQLPAAPTFESSGSFLTFAL